MKPTRWRDLLGIAALTGLVSWLLVRRFYGDIPPLPYSAAVTTFLLAAAELYLAPAIRARLAGRPRTKPIMPIAVARTAALAKASSVLGALSVGCWTGALGYLLSRLDLRHARADAVVAGVSAAVGVLLVVAALRLERACRVPPPPPAAA
ncbi:MAG TPA: DUF3180 domain-containing protein [Mycobacteriales bacterium]|nr:DUF3180 domain-containing protein [Mycobacteriales bacterium]